MHKLVLLRHGESVWNKENRFTGWVDVGLSEKGVQEAIKGGKELKKNNFIFDVVFTSIQKRAKQTTEFVLKELGQKPNVINSWRLNERHYGGLQGLNKSETAEKFGEEQVKIWRRSYDIRPPEMNEERFIEQKNNPLFKGIPEKDLPRTECLKDVVARVLPFWESDIVPAIKSGKMVLISAHGNSLRALVKYLDGVPDSDIVEFNIPTGVPLVYELDNNLKPIKHYYLGDAEEIQKAIDAVKVQGKAKK
jgi:2,3-bisphosphoglycerate-dependent phosphoglycerate mutase